MAHSFKQRSLLLQHTSRLGALAFLGAFWCSQSSVAQTVPVSSSATVDAYATVDFFPLSAPDYYSVPEATNSSSSPGIASHSQTVEAWQLRKAWVGGVPQTPVGARSTANAHVELAFTSPEAWQIRTTQFLRFDDLSDHYYANLSQLGYNAKATSSATYEFVTSADVTETMWLRMTFDLSGNYYNNDSFAGFNVNLNGQSLNGTAVDSFFGSLIGTESGSYLLPLELLPGVNNKFTFSTTSEHTSWLSFIAGNDSGAAGWNGAFDFSFETGPADFNGARDAGSSPLTATILHGDGILDAISGVLATINDVDMFKLRLAPGASLSLGQTDIWVEPTDSSGGLSSSLHLFNHLGQLVAKGTSYLPAQIGGFAPGEYYLAIGDFYTQEPITDSKGNVTWKYGSQDLSVPFSGSYQIHLKDAYFVPEPSTFAMTGLAGLLLAARAMRRKLRYPRPHQPLRHEVHAFTARPEGLIVLIQITTVAVAFAVPARAASFSFQGLGILAGGSSSQAHGVSADGSVVVGQSISGVTPSGSYIGEAFRWTSGTGMVGLGDLPGASFESYSSAASADGSVIVGRGVTAMGSEAFRWTSGGGMVGIGDVPGGFFSSGAGDVSADGSVVVGGFLNGFPDLTREAFRWTSGGGMVRLGDLPGGGVHSGASGVSADGLRIVGTSAGASGWEAFIWTTGDGMVGLGDLAGGDSESHANAISADGSVVVGESKSASGREAFRWTSSGGMVGLGDLPGGAFSSVAQGVSADGSVIVGTGYSSMFFGEAFYWTSDSGMASLRDLLVGQGVSNLSDWTLDAATGVSADGRAIIGYGTNPDGNMEAWVATVPEPATLGMGAIGTLLLAGCAWRKPVHRPETKSHTRAARDISFRRRQRVGCAN